MKDFIIIIIYPSNLYVDKFNQFPIFVKEKIIFK